MPTLLEWIAFVFAITTIPIYSFLLFILHKEVRDNTKRSNAFYLICCIVGYVDILCLLNNYLLYMPPRWNWFLDVYLRAGDIPVKIMFVISWGANFAQLQATLLMALNRFTALVFAQRHDLIWRNRARLLIAFIIFPALLLGCSTLISRVEYRIEDGELSQKLLE